MYPENGRERALYGDYCYWKGIAEAYERMLLKEHLIISASEYNKSRIMKIDDGEDK